MWNAQPYRREKQPVSPVPRGSTGIWVTRIPYKPVPRGAKVDAQLVCSSGNRTGKDGSRWAPTRQFACCLNFANCVRMFSIHIRRNIG